MLILQKNETKDASQDCDPDQADRTDSARLLYDAHIEEYNIIYDAKLMRIDIQDRTENYLFIIISASLSILPISIRAFEPIQELSRSFPSIYVILAIVSLIFPFKFLQQNIFETNLTNYLHFVLSPKLNKLIDHIPESDQNIQYTRKWERKNLPQSLHGVFKYHNYVARTLFQSRIPVIGIGALFRYIFVCTPSGIFLSFFLLEKRNSIFWIE